MRNLSRLAAGFVGLAGLSAGSYAFTPIEPDNSKVNQRDDGVVQPTADQQSNNRKDEELIRRIRSAVTSDHALSMYAHNVKIIAQNGRVVLRGPVRSADEKRIIEEKAAQLAGADHIENRLEIAPK